MKIVGISGKRGSGKSLLCNPYLKLRGFHIFSFADILKEDVRRSYGLTKEHTDGKLKELPCDKLGGETPRNAMIAEGEIRRRFSEGGMYWINKLYNDKVRLLPDAAWVAISDVRFKNEAQFIKDHEGFIVRLERKPELNIYKGIVEDLSETELDDYHFDLTLSKEENLTPQSLEKFSDRIVKLVGGK